MRAGFESLSAIFSHYASVAADEPAVAAMQAQQQQQLRDGERADLPLSRTLGQAGWLAFCADVSLGALADLARDVARRVSRVSRRVLPGASLAGFSSAFLDECLAGVFRRALRDILSVSFSAFANCS